MLRKVLVPLDGSAFAEQALPMALAIARRAGARVQLVTVRASLQTDLSLPGAEEYLDGLAGRIEPVLPGRIDRAVLTSELGRLEYPLARSTVAEVLAKAAGDLGVDLIVMTTHGRGGIRRAWLGSVADSLLRIAPRPVLLIRPRDEEFGSAIDADRGISHIVVALDGSERAERMFEHARSLGEAFGARYTLLRVLQPLLLTPAAEWSGAITAVPQPVENAEAAAQYLEGVAERMRSVGLDVNTCVLESMAPEAAIMEWAETHGADLIALSTSGLGGVRRFLIGSVADKVVRTSTLPVLLANTRSAAASTEEESEARRMAEIG